MLLVNLSRFARFPEFSFFFFVIYAIQMGLDYHLEKISLSRLPYWVTFLNHFFWAHQNETNRVYMYISNIYMCWCLISHSHCFPTVGMVINPIVGVYIPTIRIPHWRWYDHPLAQMFFFQTFCFTLLLCEDFQIDCFFGFGSTVLFTATGGGWTLSTPDIYMTQDGCYNWMDICSGKWHPFQL